MAVGEDGPMSALKDQLQGDLTAAIRAQDELTHVNSPMTRLSSS